MKESIKSRIDAVRRGEVPEGYIVENHQLHPMAWKYEKIGEYLVAYDEYSNDTERYMLATSSRQGLVPQTDYYNDQRFDETMGGFHVVPEGYVTYRHMSDDDIFKFNVNNLGAPVLVSPEYPVFTTRAELNQRLLIEYLNGANEFRTFCRAQKKGSTRTRMYFSRLGEFMMPIPPISEQEKIADILAACDRVIDLKQKRVEELKQLKKTCLAKMFPKGDADVPELRFPGFTGTWEQRKLKDICAVFTDGDWIESKDQSDQGVRLIQTGNVGVTEYLDKPNSKKWVSEDTFERLHCTEVLSGDILISRLPEPAGRACIVPKIGQKMITAVDCTIARIAPEYSSEYVVQYLSTQDYFDEVNNCLAGGTRQRISRGNLSSFLIPLPCSKAEQEQIGGFFRSLDNLITLHQRELEAERQKKKALMKLLLKGLVRVNA